MKLAAAALKAWLGIVALSWAATGLAASAGTASPGSPRPAPAATAAAKQSIELSRQQSSLAGTCGGSAFDVKTFISVDSLASADVKVTAPAVGLIEEFTDETGTNIGPYAAVYPTFHILAFGGGLAPNTPITITITTYSGPNLSGSVTFVSSLIFNCTTGAILGPIGGGVSQPVPSLSPFGLAAAATLLALLGVAILRRPARRRSARR